MMQVKGKGDSDYAKKLRKAFNIGAGGLAKSQAEQAARPDEKMLSIKGKTDPHPNDYSSVCID
jgi:hypothetical protein